MKARYILKVQDLKPGSIICTTPDPIVGVGVDENATGGTAAGLAAGPRNVGELSLSRMSRGIALETRSSMRETVRF